VTFFFKVPDDFRDDVILEVEETTNLQTWKVIASKDGVADWFFQFPNLVILESPQGGYRGVGVTASGTYTEQGDGFYRLKVRSRGIPVIVVDVEPESLQLDAFTLGEVRIDGKRLLVDVSYSGGCAGHDFQLFMSAEFLESNPVQVNLWLQHEDNDDACDGIVSESLQFDLTPVLDRYRETYGRDDEIILNVFGFFEGDPGEKRVVRYLP